MHNFFYGKSLAPGGGAQCVGRELPMKRESAELRNTGCGQTIVLQFSTKKKKF